MERGLILLLATLMVSLAPGVQGTFHLSFANNTEVNITRAGCGMTKLCLETPDDCDPTTNRMCLFGSLDTSRPADQNGVDLNVELQGYSTGYVALGLRVNASEGPTMVFVCARNSTDGGFFFRTRQTNSMNSTELIPTERRVNEIRGSVNGSVIQCEFTIPNLNASAARTMSTADTTFYVLIGIGNITDNVLGAFDVRLNGGRLNVADPAATTPAATPAATTSSSGAFQPPAVLILLSVLIYSIMLRT